VSSARSSRNVKNLVFGLFCLLLLTAIHSLGENARLSMIEEEEKEYKSVDGEDETFDDGATESSSTETTPTSGNHTDTIEDNVTEVIDPVDDDVNDEMDVDTTTMTLPIHSVTKSDNHSFVSDHCDLQDESWYPKEAWKRHAPYLVIPGVRFAGTSVLADALRLHSNITFPIRSSETQFFLNSVIQRYVSRATGKVKVKSARKVYQSRYFAKRDMMKQVALDASPGYLFYTSELPYRLLCVAPWVKLVVVLRDPMERTVHQYRSSKHRGNKVDFETYLQTDLELLKQASVINNNTIPKPIDLSKEGMIDAEDEAWRTYTAIKGEGGPIGRSLYDIPLRHWFQALKKAGKVVSKDVLIVWADQLVAFPVAQFQRIIDFLELPSDDAVHSQVSQALKKLEPASLDGLSKASVKRMEKFFKPFESRLFALLIDFGVESGRPETESGEAG